MAHQAILNLVLFSGAISAAAQFVPLREYAGQSFFDKWDFYGTFDNTTWGNVTYLDRPSATQQNLAYVNSAGNAVIKVDNRTNIAPAPLVYRNSIRITSQDTYGVGNLVIIDALHMPYGCSVWPSFWTLGTGKEWPDAGEIDIIEGINQMGNNQMALHSTPGCTLAPNSIQSGRTLETNCSLDRGCIVAETKANSWGNGFAQAGGGVFALQMDVSGIFMWFWSRPDVPDSIKSATSTSPMNISSWGMPSASYPATTCNMTQFFEPQQLILLITLCGAWAGVPDIYSSTCPGSCVADNVIGPGSPKFDNAFFEIPYIRTYTLGTAAPVSASQSASASASGQSTSGPTTPSAASTNVLGTAVSVPTSSAGLTLHSNALDVACLITTIVCISALLF
ncbi:concanavalin A-like lectin/glucanase domain-containing protein [Infundibulicybe gibba]|nr:concanavalin A-like lectin/glucanase domain-containing protein [Infundibulicybe gibba]